MSGSSPDEIEVLRLHVLDRLAALLESQTRSKFFGNGIFELVHNVHQEVSDGLHQAAESSDHQSRNESVAAVENLCARLDTSLAWLFNERNRQWNKDG